MDDFYVNSELLVAGECGITAATTPLNHFLAVNHGEMNLNMSTRAVARKGGGETLS